MTNMLLLSTTRKAALFFRVAEAGYKKGLLDLADYYTYIRKGQEILHNALLARGC